MEGMVEFELVPGCQHTEPENLGSQITVRVLRR